MHICMSWINFAVENFQLQCTCKNKIVKRINFNYA